MIADTCSFGAPKINNLANYKPDSTGSAEYPLPLVGEQLWESHDAEDTDHTDAHRCVQN
jgi:hypothetical protein